MNEEDSHAVEAGPKTRLQLTGLCGAFYQYAIPQALVAREDAQRLSRFIAAGRAVRAQLTMPNRTGGPIEVENVSAEIRGTDGAGEIVMIGAHLDWWELGSGALDNGCNTALVVEVARAIRAAGVSLRRTIRFALWNTVER